MPPRPAGQGPVFVGGTGRSGTTIMGQLVGARSDIAFVPVELRLHVDPGGLVDLASGATTVQEFAQTMHQRWFRRRTNDTGQRGLHVVADREVMVAALRKLRRAYDDDPWRACRRFLLNVLTPLLEQEGTGSFVEMTPPNAHAMDGLCRMFPRARVIHMVRDGRDVAASVARRRWGPADIDTALVWWADHLIRIDDARRRCDVSRVHTVRLEALVGPEREQSYADLVAFLGRGDDPEMRRYFDDVVTAGAAHQGAWRSGLSEEEQQHVDARYADQLRRLADHGVELPTVSEQGSTRDAT